MKTYTLNKTVGLKGATRPKLCPAASNRHSYPSEFFVYSTLFASTSFLHLGLGHTFNSRYCTKISLLFQQGRFCTLPTLCMNQAMPSNTLSSTHNYQDQPKISCCPPLVAAQYNPGNRGYVTEGWPQLSDCTLLHGTPTYILLPKQPVKLLV
ncbi:UNVERIFIED_CONTAM: hypothetical protein K2H54_015761 [Gekko kuhli]